VTVLGNFAANLRYVCALEGAVSEVCRRIGVNRQQFARYLNGIAKPSARNMIRICEHFQIPEKTFDLDHDQFVLHMRAGHAPAPSLAAQASFNQPGNPRKLRQMLGSYHAHYCSPSHPRRVIRLLVQIVEDDERFFSRTLERLRDPSTGHMQNARYSGVFLNRENNFFLIECGRTTGDVSETILSPLYRNLSNYLQGITIGLSWRTRRPFATRAIWSRIPPRVTARDAILQCGTFDRDSRDLAPAVRSFFALEERPRDANLLTDDA
jgi:transcriptional regulator with XRE-family HTH domain